jgi:hypothetical protein
LSMDESYGYDSRVESMQQQLQVRSMPLLIANDG